MLQHVIEVDDLIDSNNKEQATVSIPRSLTLACHHVSHKGSEALFQHSALRVRPGGGAQPQMSRRVDYLISGCVSVI